MHPQQLTTYINHFWDNHITPTLMEYIKIPNKSPHFDTEWEAHGHMHQAVELIANWCREHTIVGMTIDVLQLEGRTPVIMVEVAGNREETILLYGHLDKQPEMVGWSEGLAPWQPVLRDERLYGRGAADDGYAVFASLAAIKALQDQHIPHGRCVILIEASEESGSCDLPPYIDALAGTIGEPDLIICLDSCCGNYEQLWMTTSLRGLITASLSIEVLTQGVHSGTASGIIPSCFQILRQLLSRLENEDNGDILIKEMQADIPADRLEQIEQAANVLGNATFTDLPLQENVHPRSGSNSELILNRTWKPALSVIGLDGLPSVENAGNVTVPTLTAMLSIRLPPTCDAQLAANALVNLIESHPPYQAKIKCNILDAVTGWNAPAEAPWLRQAVTDASLAYFGKEAVAIGEGVSIPFMGMLGKKFPNAQFLITGVLGPESNAHGPNEFLHLPTAKKLTASIAYVISRHYQKQ